MQNRLLIYTEGGVFGLGHVQRCAVLSDELARLGVECAFVTEAGTLAAQRLGAAGKTVVPCSGDNPEWVLQYLKDDFDALLVDVEQYPGLDFMKMLRNNYQRLFLVGGVSYPSAGPLHELVDLTIYQGELFDFPESEKALNGPRYLIIAPEFAACLPDRGGPVLVSMGGRDPKQYTKKLLDGLYLECDTNFIIGPAMDRSILRWPDKNAVAFKRYPKGEGGALEKPANFDPVDADFNYGFIESPVSIVPYVNGASLAIVTTGMTAYECLAAGLPCILFNISEDHERTAAALERLGCAINMGMKPGPNQFVDAMVTVSKTFNSMSARASALVDGGGAARVAEIMCRILVKQQERRRDD